MTKSSGSKSNWLILAVVVVTAVLATLYTAVILSPRTYLFTVKAVANTVNIVNCVILMIIYGNVLRERKSNFTIGLMFIVAALFLEAFISNPMIHLALDWRVRGLTPIVVSADVFSCIATLGLLYVSKE